MQKKTIPVIVQNNSGFSLLEVLLGITIFMIGMLGVTALNISSLKSNTFSGNMSEAVIIAGDKLEELMAMDFENVESGNESNIGRNDMYIVTWNVVDDEPLPAKTKTINVSVEWSVKDVKRLMNMSTVIMDRN